jgi:hypothetical protein
MTHAAHQLDSYTLTESLVSRSSLFWMLIL